MADRERIVEVLMGALPDLPTPGPNVTQGFVKHIAANEVLGALEAAGYVVVSIELYDWAEDAYDRDYSGGEG